MRWLSWPGLVVLVGTVVLLVAYINRPAPRAPMHSIRGIVVDETGRPIPLIERGPDGFATRYKGGVGIVATNAREGSDMSSTYDDKGGFSLPGLGAGRYTIKVVVPGYEPQLRVVEVGQGKPVFVRFVLKKLP